MRTKTTPRIALSQGASTSMRQSTFFLHTPVLSLAGMTCCLAFFQIIMPSMCAFAAHGAGKTVVFPVNFPVMLVRGPLHGNAGAFGKAQQEQKAKP